VCGPWRAGDWCPGVPRAPARCWSWHARLGSEAWATRGRNLTGHHTVSSSPRPGVSGMSCSFGRGREMDPCNVHTSTFRRPQGRNWDVAVSRLYEHQRADKGWAGAPGDSPLLCIFWPPAEARRYTDGHRVAIHIRSPWICLARWLLFWANMQKNRGGFQRRPSMRRSRPDDAVVRVAPPPSASHPSWVIVTTISSSRHHKTPVLPIPHVALETGAWTTLVFRWALARADATWPLLHCGHVAPPVRTN